VITEITLRLHGIPEAISAAVCSFETLAGAVDTVVHDHSVRRADRPGGNPRRHASAGAINAGPKLDYPELTPCSSNSTAPRLRWPNRRRRSGSWPRPTAAASSSGRTCPKSAPSLWEARHQAYYAAVGLRKGAVGWPTDCAADQPAGRMHRRDQARPARRQHSGDHPRHVGDGNFHVVFVLDPDSREEAAEAEHLNRRLVERAPAMDGTCTGEHGIGLGKAGLAGRRAWRSGRYHANHKAGAGPQGPVQAQERSSAYDDIAQPPPGRPRTPGPSGAVLDPGPVRREPCQTCARGNCHGIGAGRSGRCDATHHSRTRRRAGRERHDLYAREAKARPALHSPHPRRRVHYRLGGILRPPDSGRWPPTSTVSSSPSITAWPRRPGSRAPSRTAMPPSPGCAKTPAELASGHRPHGSP